MPNKPLTACIVLSLLLLPGRMLAAGELSTLFTTPQERQLINANRYKTDEVKPQPVQVVPDETPVQLMVQEDDMNSNYFVRSFTYPFSGKKPYRLIW